MLVRWFALLFAAVIVTASAGVASASMPSPEIADCIEAPAQDLTPDLSQDAWAMPASFAGPSLGFWEPAITHGAPAVSPGRVHGVFVFRPPR